MPVTRSRTGMYDVGLDQTNTTRFLFGDEETNAGGHSGPDANFPTLVRHDDQIYYRLRPLANSACTIFILYLLVHHG